MVDVQLKHKVRKFDGCFPRQDGLCVLHQYEHRAQHFTFFQKGSIHIIKASVNTVDFTEDFVGILGKG